MSSVYNESMHRMQELLHGMRYYQQYSHHRSASIMPSIMNTPLANLYDYSNQTQYDSAIPNVLFIPSMINRSYIMDMDNNHSMLRFLKGCGIRPFLLSWNEPNASTAQGSFQDVIDMVTQSITHIAKASDRPLILAGYCMGGLMAMAGMANAKEHVSHLALLATPWDFQAESYGKKRVTEQHLPGLEKILQQYSVVPADIIQNWFYYQNPFAVNNKFRKLGRIEPDANESIIKPLMHIMQWSNDGMAMTHHVAREALYQWGYKNAPYRGETSYLPDPASMTLPVWMAIPQYDTIVPPASSYPLASLFPNITVTRPASGHVSMVAGSKAKEALWQPFAMWVKAMSAI